MRSDLLRSLQCLSCRKTDFALTVEAASDEIDTGALTCRICGRTYAIDDGVLIMLDRLTPTMANEIEGWQRFSEDEGWSDPPDDYLLCLPRPKARVATDTLNWHWHADNFERGAATTACEGKFVLDLAAGRCWTTRELAHRGARCVATDILIPENIGLKTGKRYIRHTGDYFDRVACSMLTLPFRDGAFDVVFAYASMHHAEDLEAAMVEAARVLRPGGEFVLAGEPVGRFYESAIARFRRHAYDLHERSPRLSEWLAGLLDAGITDVEILREAVFDVHASQPLDRALRALANRWPFVYRVKLSVLGGILIEKGVKSSHVA